MSKTVVLFGTESGNAEMVAEDFITELEAHGSAALADMTDFDIADFDPSDSYIIVCSTHGDGELPSGAWPFLRALEEETPDLTGIRFRIFGLGNSSYEIYSHGSEIIDEKLRELGAERIGVYGRHDASDGSLPNDSALEWLQDALIPA